jgi:hypothetical protein
MAKKRKEIVYENIIESNLLVQNDNTTIRVEFLNNGFIDEVELDSGKIVDSYIYGVKDLDDSEKEKEWSTLSTRAVRILGSFMPLKGKRFSIRKYTTSDKPTDKYYDINEM